MRLCPFLLGLAAESSAMATTYYISPSGNNANPIYFPSWAWRTVAHVNSVGLRSGDEVLFERGGTWRETLIPQTNSLSYGACGGGLRPVFSGADLLSAKWFTVVSNIWSFPLPSYPPTQTWLNAIGGTAASSLASVLAPEQWFYGSGNLYIYSSGNPSTAYASPGVEVTQWDQPLLIQNVGNITICDFAFVDGACINIRLGSNVTGYQTFQGELSQGALDPYEIIDNLCASVTANPAYTCVIRPNKDYFTPSVLANVSLVNIKASYTASAKSGYTFEVEGSQSDVLANLPGFCVTSFATPFTSSNTTVENHIRDAGFSIIRNGTVNSAFTPNGNWLFSSLDIYNIGAEWLPDQFDSTKPAASLGALVQALGAAGGVLAVYSHGYDQFSRAHWTQLFSTMRSISGGCLTRSQASAYIHSHGSLVPDGTAKNWVQTVVQAPKYARTPLSPPSGAQGFHLSGRFKGLRQSSLRRRSKGLCRILLCELVVSTSQ
jgi:hypothetical protein